MQPKNRALYSSRKAKVKETLNPLQIIVLNFTKCFNLACSLFSSNKNIEVTELVFEIYAF